MQICKLTGVSRCGGRSGPQLKRLAGAHLRVHSAARMAEFSWSQTTPFGQREANADAVSRSYFPAGVKNTQERSLNRQRTFHTRRPEGQRTNCIEERT